MKSFGQHLKESPLHDIAQKHDDTIDFVRDALRAIKDKKIKLKTRGVSNTRELAGWFVKYKDKKKKKLDDS
jgi:hypothetical protein|tara:strand:- start:799 stop:1011 length:213 start_codon:yes stop_codon:yes gene_type:complete